MGDWLRSHSGDGDKYLAVKSVCYVNRPRLGICVEPSGGIRVIFLEVSLPITRNGSKIECN